MGMTYSDTRKFVGGSCKASTLAWSAVVALPKGVSDAQRQEALQWLQQYQSESRPRVKPRKRES
jgi:hypothetical protein